MHYHKADAKEDVSAGGWGNSAMALQVVKGLAAAWQTLTADNNVAARKIVP